jgi:hypothetical protein
MSIHTNLHQFTCSYDAKNNEKLTQQFFMLLSNLLSENTVIKYSH